MTEHTTTRTPDTLCPLCSRKLNGATSVYGPHVPKPGALAVCGFCGALLEFSADLRVVLLSDRRFLQLGSVWKARLTRTREMVLGQKAATT